MSTEEKINSGLKSYTSDLLALETHFMNAVKKQKTSEVLEDDKVIELLNEIENRISDHTDSLQSYLKSIGGSVQTEIKTGIATFSGYLAGMLEGAGTTSVSRMLRDDYVALSLISIGYTMLHTYALADEDYDLAKITINNMGNCTSMITELSKIVPLAVAGELIKDDAARAEEIGHKALENTQAAWRPEVVNQEPRII